MEEVDAIGDVVFNEHSLGVAADERGGGYSQLVGEDQGRFFMAQVGNGQLPDGSLVVIHVNPLVKDSRGSVDTSQSLQFNAPPGRKGFLADFFEQPFRPPAQGDEGDIHPVEAVEICIGGQP